MTITAEEFRVTNPATGADLGGFREATTAEVDAAVRSARQAFAEWSRTTREERQLVLARILEAYRRRMPQLADAITAEMGAPTTLARGPQVKAGVGHLTNAGRFLADFDFEQQRGDTLLLREPIGVAGLITPWNWPLHQILCKVCPALASGCTVVLKPSEVTPTNALILQEVLAEADVPDGVFNLVLGTGARVGRALAAHPELDLISFTGSTRAGVDVAAAAAPTVKRVSQELGGKSPNLILDDADLETVVPAGVTRCYSNSGQSCNAPTRMLVPEHLHTRALELAVARAEEMVVGDPTAAETTIGPVAHGGQYDRVQALIESGVRDGAVLATGGLGRPDGLDRGNFVRPTVLGGVSNNWEVAREEIFGPVLCVIPYRDEQDAVRIANDTDYGLAAYVQSGDGDRARAVARQLRAGQVVVNGAPIDDDAPFGGFKRSGNGREKGPIGMADFLEYKAVMG